MIDHPDARLPDPTLMDCNLGLVAVEKQRFGYVAHRIDTRTPDDSTFCGVWERRTAWLEPTAAAYFAVPCRNSCFPDAPPPGHELGCPGEFCSAAHPHLGWQLRKVDA